MTDETPLDLPINQPLAAPPAMPEGQPRSDTANAARDRQSHDGLLQSRGAVLGFVFLVAGVVGLPLLWVNPNFSRRERVFWTVIVLFYTCTLLVLFGGMMWWIYQLLVGA